MPNEDQKPTARGPKPEHVKLDISFEEAVSHAMRVKKPEGGFPDFRTRQRREKDSEK